MVWLIGMVYHAGCATRLWAACGSGELACDSVFLFGSCLGISQDFKAVSKQQPSEPCGTHGSVQGTVPEPAQSVFSLVLGSFRIKRKRVKALV